MHAEIISIGDEITSGQLLDTNSQWLSQRLEELGIRVLYHAAVGDELEPLAAVFRQALERSDVIIATGGLGPTADDLTRQAVAQALGCALEFRAEAMEHIRRLFARRGRTMPDSNRLQAMFPVGSRIIDNPEGTAPGIAVELARAGRPPARLYALPGVPAEMRQMWHESLVGWLRAAGGTRVVVHKKINTFGAGESTVEAMLPDLIRRGRDPRVGINASQATIILRITAEGPNEAECLAKMAPTIQIIRETLGRFIFGEDDKRLEDAVARLLAGQRKTLATAEWGTAGLVGDWLGEAAGAGGFYLGGVTVLSQPALGNLLGSTDAELSSEPTSGEVAAVMASGCRTRYGADYGLAVSRFPALLGDEGEPGTFAIALAKPEGTIVRTHPYASHPALLKTLAAKQALNLLRLSLLGVE